ncbi:fimbrial protein [Alcaligenaceae bacterium A4P071]|nr:fimbrial protein [Alcaligenaceae bacterium A4P071]
MFTSPQKILCRLAVCLCLFAAGGFVDAALANMTVYPMATTVAGARNVSNTIQVFSKSDQTQYVQVKIKRVIAPATPNEREEPISAWKGTGIVASPPKFALPGGASRAVRIVSLDVPDVEALYRVYFEPVAAPDDGSGMPDRSTHGSVSVNLIWGVLVRALPSEPKLAMSRQADTDALTNDGNVRVGARQVGRCVLGAPDDSCQWTALERNVYPGGALPLPPGLRHEFIRLKFHVQGHDAIQSRDFAPVP